MSVREGCLEDVWQAAFPQSSYAFFADHHVKRSCQCLYITNIDTLAVAQRSLQSCHLVTFLHDIQWMRCQFAHNSCKGKDLRSFVVQTGSDLQRGHRKNCQGLFAFLVVLLISTRHRICSGDTKWDGNLERVNRLMKEVIRCELQGRVGDDFDQRDGDATIETSNTMCFVDVPCCIEHPIIDLPSLTDTSGFVLQSCDLWQTLSREGCPQQIERIGTQCCSSAGYAPADKGHPRLVHLCGYRRVRIGQKSETSTSLTCPFKSLKKGSTAVQGHELNGCVRNGQQLTWHCAFPQRLSYMAPNLCVYHLSALDPL